jgi:hypothetical protein
MNLKELTLYMVKQPKINGHLGNSFFHLKRFNIEGSEMYFTIEQQTLFNFKLVYYLGTPAEQITKTTYIVSSSTDDFLTKYKLMLSYFYKFPAENFIVI